MDSIQNNQFQEIENKNDIELSKTSTSKFMFYLGLFGFLLFTFGCGYGLWSRGYSSTAGVDVPASTTFSPTYK